MNLQGFSAQNFQKEHVKMNDGDPKTYLFKCLFTLLVFAPPLIYSYSKNLLDKALELYNKDTDNAKSILTYYYFTDQITYIWVLYVLFCLFVALIELSHLSWFSEIVIMGWITYVVIVFGLSIWVWGWAKRMKSWKTEGKVCIAIVGVYSVFPISSVLFYYRVFANLERNFNNTFLSGFIDEAEKNFDSIFLWMFGIALGYYLLWWASSLIKLPMQAFIDLKRN